MGTVSEMRRSVIPGPLYDLVFAFATGDITMMRVTVMRSDGTVDQLKFGESDRQEEVIKERPINLHVI